ncbi:1549_t:CDS:1, partial [Gigaspora margarita]
NAKLICKHLMAILEDNNFNCEEHLPPKLSFKQTDLDHLF